MKSFLDFAWENNMIFDTHLHLNDEKYTNVEELIKEANKEGVKLFLCIGYDLESSKKAIEIANKYGCVYAAIGFIPTEHRKYDENSINELKKIYKTTNKCIAIGEIGLDYYWEKDEEIKAKQKKMFIEQIELANELNLPISLHARDSLGDTLEILKEHKVKNSGVMHCYSGSKELAKEFIKLGFKIAFGGVLTFKNSVTTKEVIKNIDLKDIVFETDAPYLAPVPYRGKINLPKYIKKTIEFASELLEIEENELERISFMNSCDIFHVKNYED